MPTTLRPEVNLRTTGRQLCIRLKRTHHAAAAAPKTLSLKSDSAAFRVTIFVIMNESPTFQSLRTAAADTTDLAAEWLAGCMRKALLARCCHPAGASAFGHAASE
ncbi:MAG: hypothetical protein WA373_03810 [Burkholderiales bacterium]